MNYFKHTNGEAFILDRFDYVGYFNITDGVAYTGKLFDKDSQMLKPKDRFITDTYMGEYEMNTTYRNTQPSVEYYANAFDIFNNMGLEKLTSNIKTNNTIAYKDLVISNPVVYNFEDNDGFYYGLSSVDETDSLSIPAKKNYSGHCEPFESSTNFKFMDKITSGVLFVDNRENFTYLLTDGERNYSYIGKFNNTDPLTHITSIDNISFEPEDYAYKNPDYVYSIYKDEINNKILYVKTSNIEVHDASNYSDCETTILEDRISLIPSNIIFLKWTTPGEKWTKQTVKCKWSEKFIVDNKNNPSTIKFGKDYRTQINDAGDTLIISNKYSSDVLKTFNLPGLNIFNIISIDIRTADDYVVILHKNSDKFTISHFSVDDISNIKQWNIESLITTAKNYKVAFVEYDSDVFILSNDMEYQTRFLSNPTYPSGRLETGELHYPIPTVWQDTIQLWRTISHKWDTQITSSNFYKNLTTATCIKNNKMYMILHNVGRIYVISQPINQRFIDLIPLDLSRKFKKVSCGDTSIGLKLNLIFRNLIEDTLSILRNSSNAVSIEERKLIYEKLEDFALIPENLFMNTNETLNVLMVGRILSEIYKIQAKIIPKSIVN
jgi:hypothetical protein